MAKHQLTDDEKIELDGMCIHPIVDSGIIWYLIRDMETNEFWNRFREDWVSSPNAASSYDYRDDAVTAAKAICLTDRKSDPRRMAVSGGGEARG